MTIHRLSLIFSHWLWCRYILEEVEQNDMRQAALEGEKDLNMQSCLTYEMDVAGGNRLH